MVVLEYWTRSDILSKAKFVPYFIIIMAASIPFLLSDYGIIDSVDANFPIRPFEKLMETLSTWDTSYGFGGNASFSNPNALPYYLVLAMASLFLNIETLSKLWYITIFALGGCSMYWFTTNFLREEYRTIGGISAAFFFMFNPVQVQALVHGISNFHLAWYSLPLVLTLFIKGFSARSNNSFFCYAVAFSLALTFLQMSTDIQNRIIIIIPYVLYIIFLLCKEDAKKRIVVRFAVILGLSLAFNAFWILPASISIDEVYNILSSEQEIYRSIENAGEGFLNIIRLAVAPTFAYYYEITWVIHIGLILFIIMIIGIVRSLKSSISRPIAVYLLFSMFLYIALTRGTLSPFGGVYEFIINIPGGDVLLTNAPQKYIYHLLLPFSFFIGFITTFLLTKLNAIAKKSFLQLGLQVLSVSLIGSSVILVSLPLFTHPQLNQSFSYMASVRIPQYYSDAYEWLEQQDDGSYRIFTVPPPAWRSYSHYNWSPYDMSEIIQPALSKQVVIDFPGVVQHNTQDQLPLIHLITDRMITDNDEDLTSTLSKLNVKYILKRDDLWFGAMGHNHISNNFELNYQHEQRFDSLTFYSIPNLGRIYFPDNVIMLRGDLPHMLQVNKFDIFNNTAFVLMDTESKSNIGRQFLNSSNTIIYAADNLRSELTQVNGTIYVKIVGSAYGGESVYNIYDITREAVVVTAGIGKSLAPHEKFSDQFSLEYLNSVGQVEIAEGDELVITDIGGGYSSNIITVGGNEELPTSINQPELDRQAWSALSIGYLIESEGAKINIPKDGYFRAESTTFASVRIVKDQSNIILRPAADDSTNNSIFIKKGTYEVFSESSQESPTLIIEDPINFPFKGAKPYLNEKSSTHIEIYNPSGRPYVAILTDGFSPLWKTQSDSQLHFIANGYANGFISGDGSNLSIIFLPQEFFFIGSIVSVSSIVMSLVILIRNSQRSIMS